MMAEDRNLLQSRLKEWTVMVFINAKNNLESYGLGDVNEMRIGRGAGSTI